MSHFHPGRSPSPCRGCLSPSLGIPSPWCRSLSQLQRILSPPWTSYLHSRGFTSTLMFPIPALDVLSPSLGVPVPISGVPTIEVPVPTLGVPVTHPWGPHPHHGGPCFYLGGAAPIPRGSTPTLRVHHTQKFHPQGSYLPHTGDSIPAWMGVVPTPRVPVPIMGIPFPRGGVPIPTLGVPDPMLGVPSPAWESCHSRARSVPFPRAHPTPPVPWGILSNLTQFAY